MISISHWGMYDEPERSWLDRGDGLPVFYDRESGRAALKEWSRRMEGENRIDQVIRARNWNAVSVDLSQGYIRFVYRD